MNLFYKDVAGAFVCLRMERSSLHALGVRVVFDSPADVGSKRTFGWREFGAALFPHIHAPITASMVASMTAIQRDESTGEFLAAGM